MPTKKSPPKSLLARSSQLVGLAAKLAAQEAAARFSGAKARVDQARALVESLTHLRGAALKLGQSLSVELGDLLPPEINKILTQLHDQARAMPESTVREILARELGRHFVELQNLTPDPIAAASIGQVHRANWHNQDLAIKIQFPGIDRSVDSDLGLLSKILTAGNFIVSKEVDFSGLLEELKDVLIQETDYKKEAALLTEYTDLTRSIRGIAIPRVFSEISTSHVLAMSYESGIKLGAWMEQSPPLELREFYARKMLELYICEFYQNGVVQTDPNFGNFLFWPEKRELVLLDFGATRKYSVAFRKKYHTLLHAVASQNKKLAREISFEMDFISSRESEETLKIFDELLETSFEPFRIPNFDFNDPDYARRARQSVRNLVTALKYSAPPRGLILLHRKLGGVFHFLRNLHVKISLQPYLDQIETSLNSLH